MQCRGKVRGMAGCRRTLWLVLRWFVESQQSLMQCGHPGGAKPQMPGQRVKEVDRCPGLAGSPSRSPPTCCVILGKSWTLSGLPAFFSTKWGHSTQTPKDSRDSVTVLGPPRHEGDISSLMIMGMDTRAPVHTCAHARTYGHLCERVQVMMGVCGVAWLHGSPLTRTSLKDPVTHRGL